MKCEIVCERPKKVQTEKTIRLWLERENDRSNVCLMSQIDDGEVCFEAVLNPETMIKWWVMSVGHPNFIPGET
jgi:hypothetical protein